MFKKSGILTFYCETPLHMGAGTSVSYVDLPIQRERHTDFPIMQATGIKGVLREAFERQTDDKTLTELIFGPEKGDSFASCISITDAKILLFPVRSASGIFAWITCPFVLERFKKDTGISDIPEISTPAENEIIVAKEKDNLLKIEDKYVFLEEFVFDVKEVDEISEIVNKIKNLLPSNNLILNTLSQRFAIVNDNVFTDFVKMAVEIRTRIKIDQATGTVGEGPFVEEFVPSESIFYSIVSFNPPFLRIEKEKRDKIEEYRKNNQPFEEVKKLLKENKEEMKYIEKAYNEEVLNEDGVREKFQILSGEVFQFGGDETVGSGIVRMKLSNCESESKNESNKEMSESE